MKLRTEIMVPTLLTSGILIFMGALVFSNFMEKKQKESVASQMRTISELEAESIERYFHSAKKNIERESSKETYKEFLMVVKNQKKDDSDNDTFLFFNEINNFISSNPGIKNAILVDDEGKIIVSTRSGIYGTETFADVYQQGIFEEMKNTVIFSDLFFLPDSETSDLKKEKKPIILLGSPIWNQQKLLGVIIAEIDFDVIDELLNYTEKIGRTSHAYLVGRDLLLRSDSRFTVPEDILRQEIKSHSTQLCFEKIDKTNKTDIYRDFRGEEVIGDHHYLPEMDWCLISEIEKKEALASVRNTRSVFLWSTLALITLLFFLFRFISDKISAPFDSLGNAIEKIIQGDLSARIKTTNGPIEIKKLARQFNVMAEMIEENTKKTDRKIDMQTQKIRKQKEKFEALANDLKKFKLAVESASDQIIITDPEGKIIYANEAMEKITGFRIEEVLGKKSGGLELGGGMMPQKYYEKMWDTIKNKKKKFVGEIKNKKKNGEEYISQLRISPILNTKGKILFFVAIRHDITKERENEKMKNEFVDIVSHELRTPMTLIKGYVSMILEEYEKNLPEEAMKQMEIVLKNTENLIKMVNDLLDVSKIESGKMESMQIKELIPFSDLFKKVHDDFSPALNEKGIQLELELPKNLKNPQVFYNYDALRRVLTNIIGNAIKFVPEKKGEIIVRFQNTKGKHYIVSIEDNGPGIRIEDQKKLFTKFGMAEPSLHHTTGGTGLGLAICKSIVEHNGGTISSSSRKSGGACFSFTIVKKK